MHDKYQHAEDTTPRYTMSHAVARLGGSPSARTIAIYLRDGLVQVHRDSQGRALFSDRDLSAIRQVHEMRCARTGRTARRVTLTDMG
jgi:DNA-binding transcriptional MerR regulator